MPEKSSEATPWIILGVGIVIGSVFAYGKGSRGRESPTALA